MEVDFLIVGKGLCGTLLGRCLVQAGRSVVVIDDGSPQAASRVAGGIINPVTGKRLVRSWMTDELLPFARTAYRQIEDELGVPVLKESSILDFFANNEQRGIFSDRVAEHVADLSIKTNEQEWASYFRFNYGIGEIKPSLLVDIGLLINGWGTILKEKATVIEAAFSWDECLVEADGVLYKEIRAKKMICCEGAGGGLNPYFGQLPWSKDKGEAIIAAIPGLPRAHIFKQEFAIVPWKEDLFWIGATHDWKYTNMLPTTAFRKRVEVQLGYWLKLPYEIKDHIVAARPANLERKPFVGLHPKYPSIGILNGMGGKGVSMAPYFAHQLAGHLLHGGAISPEVDVRRFAGILKRS
jgi:glycine/D-amino acid oxidase-like deaminating enzyme